MSRLEDLISSIEDMSTEELLALTRSIRADRRITKASPRSPKASGVKVKKASDKLTQMLQSMSPAQREELLKQMQGK